jgi:hypothetical protein
MKNLELTDLNRVSVYNAEFEWNAKDFDLRDSIVGSLSLGWVSDYILKQITVQI